MTTSESTIALDVSAISGSYKLESSKNYDEYLKELGTGLLARKTQLTQTPIVRISVNGDQWTIRTESSLNNTEQTFQLGQEFDVTRPDGEHVKAVVSSGDQCLIEVQEDRAGKTAEIKRDFSQPQQMIETLTYGSTVATRIYKKTE